MQPTHDTIEMAAYQRWERRGFLHGFDREDWVSAEKDVRFARNYNWIARHKLEADRGTSIPIGRPASGQARSCRYCELSEPTVTFEETPLLIPRMIGNTALVAWDECDDCHHHASENLEASLETFMQPWLNTDPDLETIQAEGIAAAAHKALVRMGLGLLPETELQHFGDTIEWVNNPDHDRDASLLDEFGVRIYLPKILISAPFAMLARRLHEDPQFPYMLFFLGTPRAVFQVRLPLSPRDEDLDATDLDGPELSMSIGSGPQFRPSEALVLRVKPTTRSKSSKPAAKIKFDARRTDSLPV